MYKPPFPKKPHSGLSNTPNPNKKKLQKRQAKMCPNGRLDLAGAAPGLRPAFDVLDADRDGRISRDDLKAFYSSLAAANDRCDDDDIAAMIAAADANRDGFVAYEEFEGLLGRSTAGGGYRSAMEEAFRVMDRDGDGKVGFEDLKAYLGWAGMPATDEEIRAMIRVAGGDDDGGVCLEALARVLAVDFGNSV